MIKIKTEQIEQLIQIIHEQNAWYIGAIAFVIAVMTIFLGFYSFQQKKISDKQVQKFMDEIKKAEKINEDLRKSNESIIQYSLTAMSREDYFTSTDWAQRARLYLTSKAMYSKYYSKNNELKQNLEEAKASVISASENHFQALLARDGKINLDLFNEVGSSIGQDVNDKWKARLKSAYIMQDVEDFSNYEILIKFDVAKMKEIGHELDDPEIQNKWFAELDRVNTFAEDETLN